MVSFNWYNDEHHSKAHVMEWLERAKKCWEASTNRNEQELSDYVPPDQS